MRRVGDFGVELHAEERFGLVADRGVGAGGGRGEGDEVVAEGLDLVAVGHPRGGVPGDALEQTRVVGDLQPDAAVLARLRVLDLAAEQLAAGLHAVADPEHRDPQVKQPGVGLGRVGVVDRRRPAAEDDALGV